MAKYIFGLILSNRCHFGAPYKEWFTGAPRMSQDVVRGGQLTHEQILRCMIRGWYYTQNDPYIHKIMKNHLIAVHAKYDVNQEKKNKRKKKKKR